MTDNKREPTRFSNFVTDVHPDPDFFFTKVEEAFNEIGKLADHYVKALGKTHCRVCGKKIDHKKKISMCTPCLTSNA